MTSTVPPEPPNDGWDPDAQPWQRNLLAHHAEPPAETPTQPDRDAGYGQPEAECRRVHRFSPETGWASREEMVNGGHMVCGCGSVFFHHTGPGRWSCSRCGQPPRQPPAETQQDEKRDRYGHTPADHRANGCLRPSMDARVAASATEYPRGSDLAVAFERGWDAHRLAVRAAESS